MIRSSLEQISILSLNELTQTLLIKNSGKFTIKLEMLQEYACGCPVSFNIVVLILNALFNYKFSRNSIEILILICNTAHRGLIQAEISFQVMLDIITLCNPAGRINTTCSLNTDKILQHI